VPTTTFPEFEKFDIVKLYDAPPRSRLERLFRRAAPMRLAFKLQLMDIINIHDNRGLLFFFTALLLRRASSYVWQINDLHHSFGLGNSTNVPIRWYHPIARGMNKLMAHLVDSVTVNVSKNVERVRQNLGVNAELLYCGVDFPVKAENIPLPPTTPFRVLSTGVFFKFRNYERLVEAAAQAGEQLGQPLELTIVGDTRYAPEYAKQVRIIANSKRVHLSIKENLSDQELEDEIANCHVFVFVNIDQSWGLAVFETAARGRAVILSNSVGAAELLSNSKGVYLVDPISVYQITQALIAFMKSPQLCSEYGQAAAFAVSDMTWDKMYSSKLEALFVRQRKNAS
jgi:glycosyltransferase involved in cell wall biosynthesis